MMFGPASNAPDGSDKIETIELSSVKELFAELRNTERWGNGLGGTWLFRGMPETRWRLLPRIWRGPELSKYEEALRKIDFMVAPNYDRWLAEGNNKFGHGYLHKPHAVQMLVRIRVLQSILMRSFKMVGQECGLISGVSDNWGYEYLEQTRLRDVLDGNSTVDEFALAQHYGLPTHLLDWTRDPLKAIWFSIESSPLPDSKPCIWAIDRTQIPNYSNDNKYALGYIRIDRSTNPFLHAQDGVLTEIFGYERFLDDYGHLPAVEDLFSTFPKGAVRKYLIPSTVPERAEIIRLLWREGRSLPHLMPSMGNVADFADQIVRLGLFDRKL
jgi:hypothetical protein